MYNFGMKIDGIKIPRIKTFVKEKYDSNGTLVCKSRFAKASKALVKDVFFHPDGKTVMSVTHYDPKNGEILHDAFFSPKGKFTAYFTKKDFDTFK